MGAAGLLDKVGMGKARGWQGGELEILATPQTATPAEEAFFLPFRPQDGRDLGLGSILSMKEFGLKTVFAPFLTTYLPCYLLTPPYLFDEVLRILRPTGSDLSPGFVFY